MANYVYSMNFMLRNDPIAIEIDTFPKQMNDDIYLYMWGPSEFTATGTLKNRDITSRLSEIKVPVLFITGEYDEARPSTVEYFHNLVPGSQFEVIKGAAHSTMHDNLSRNVKVINKFLKDVERKK
ncbi:MAG: hypothetical protein JXB49_07205 [Bacteroidales bacterium]|nr:hypothetical protein [Bacteroidales bacterium]